MNFLRKPFSYTYINATLKLVIINALVYALTFFLPFVKVILGLSFDGIYLHWYWQFVTSLFVHGNMPHILVNMLTLFCFGTVVERAMGSREFLLFYFVCGILETIGSMAIYYILRQPVFLIGASGAIYAILFAYAVIFPKNKIYIWAIIPVQAPLLIVIYAVIELGSQIFGFKTGIGHISHLLGLVFAWIYLVVRMGINPLKVWRDAYRQ